MNVSHSQTRAAAADIMRAMLAPDVSEQYVVDLLIGYQGRGVCAEELLGFIDALGEVGTPIDLGTRAVLDLCGTGGDGKNTFNISTTTAFVVAGAGIPVAKHGNSAFSSSVGSSDVLKVLGVPLHSSVLELREDLESHGLCFLHAPFFYPSLKTLAPIRRKIGHATIFNILGPLLNPARPQFQCLGVKSPNLVDLYSEVLLKQGVKFNVIHSLDGYDEISLTGDFVVGTYKGQEVFQPEKLGFARRLALDLNAPDSVEGAAQLIELILQNKGSEAQKAVVLANAGFAIKTFRSELTIHEALECAKESLEWTRLYMFTGFGGSVSFFDV